MREVEGWSQLVRLFPLLKESDRRLLFYRVQKMAGADHFLFQYG
jgi:hypothetical protein